ncbi:MAG: flavin reductase family protein [Verrucomicrobiota bacterium]
MDKEVVGPALGKISSGIYIATGKLDGRPVGMLCSFVEQASFHPPLITIAIGPDRLLAKALQTDPALGLNVLGDHNKALMGPFASSANENPFAEVDLKPNDHGLPQLVEALSFLRCEVRQCVEAGDHLLFLAEVLDGELQDDEEEPMIRFRRNGFQY